MSRDEELVFPTKRLYELNNKKYRPKRRPKFKNNDVKENQIICYGCNNVGHYIVDCPLNRKKFKKKSNKKAMVANSTWSYSDESSWENEEEEKEEEIVNICFMAQSEQGDQEVNYLDTSYDELYNDFQQLLNDSMKLSKSYFALKFKYDDALVEIIN